MIDKIPLTVETIQYNSDQIDVNNESTQASTITFRASNIRSLSKPPYGLEPGLTTGCNLNLIILNNYL